MRAKLGSLCRPSPSSPTSTSRSCGIAPTTIRALILASGCVEPCTPNIELTPFGPNQGGTICLVVREGRKAGTELALMH